MDIYKMDLLEFGKSVLKTYAVVIITYALISYVVYAYRYSKARKSLRLYYMNLRKLSGMYSNK